MPGTNGFSIREISSIIETCKLCGVSEISIGSLRICFHKGLEGNQDLPKTLEQASPIQGATEIAQPKVEVTEKDLQMWRDAAEAQVLIDDPFRYEQMQIDNFRREHNNEETPRAQ